MAECIVKQNSDPKEYLTEDMDWSTDEKQAWKTDSKEQANAAHVAMLMNGVPNYIKMNC